MNDLVLTFQTKDSKNVVLRQATLEDAPEIVAKAKAIESNGPFIQKEIVRTPSQEREFINEVKRKDNMYIVIQVENSVVGIARLCAEN